ncbi:MAG: PIN domain-containing protein [Candidatus Weimeria sp.]
MRGKRKRIPIPEKNILEKEMLEMTKAEIARKHKASVTTLNRWLDSYDLKKPERIHFSQIVKTAGTSQKTSDKAEESVKEEKKSVKETEADKFKKDRDDLLLFLAPRLKDVSLTGVRICPDESVNKSLDMKEMADTINRAIKDMFSSTLYPVYQTADDTLYFTETALKKYSANRSKTLKWNVWDKYGIYIVYHNRRGYYYTDGKNLLSDIEETLTSLKDSAKDHIGDVPSRYSDTENVSPIKPLPKDSGPIKVQGNIFDDINPPLIPATEDSATMPEISDEDEEEEDEYLTTPLTSDEEDELIDNAIDTFRIGDEEKPEIKEVRFIDSENVNCQWKNILTDDPAVKTVILYTDSTPKISYDTLKEILEHPTGIELTKVNAGEKAASALDFQLVSIMGYMISENPDRKYVIVSLDKGYDPCVSYWKNKGIDVSRLPMLNRELPKGRERLCKPFR